MTTVLAKASDHPILFSAPMVLAQIREVKAPGTGKTQTRRTLKALRRFGAVSEFGLSDTPGYDWHFRDRQARWHDLRHSELLDVLPYAVGDRLWVREAWSPADRFYQSHGLDVPRVVAYRADKSARRFDPETSTPIPAYDIDQWNWDILKWKPGIHMWRWASRLTLTVTDVRVQCLQEISAEDARDEGVDRRSRSVRQMWLFGASAEERAEIYLRACIWEYEQLWNAINGVGAWDENPWIVAVTFRPEMRNIDAKPDHA
jgi:hypothetical protein